VDFKERFDAMVAKLLKELFLLCWHSAFIFLNSLAAHLETYKEV